jgi:hypothetical protein
MSGKALDPFLEFGFEFAAGDLEFLEGQETKADGDVHHIQEHLRSLGQRVFGLFSHMGVLSCRFFCLYDAAPLDGLQAAPDRTGPRARFVGCE